MRPVLHNVLGEEGIQHLLEVRQHWLHPEMQSQRRVKYRKGEGKAGHECANAAVRDSKNRVAGGCMNAQNAAVRDSKNRVAGGCMNAQMRQCVTAKIELREAV
jgi:hypothetical protein